MFAVHGGISYMLCVQQQYFLHAHSSMLWMYWQQQHHSIHSAKTKHINIVTYITMLNSPRAVMTEFKVTYRIHFLFTHASTFFLSHFLNIPAYLFISGSSKAVSLGAGLAPQGRSSLGMSLSPARVPDVDPIDAAAHLQLLGESLSLIGHRLQETEVCVADMSLVGGLSTYRSCP